MTAKTIREVKLNAIFDDEKHFETKKQQEIKRRKQQKRYKLDVNEAVNKILDVLTL